MNDMVSFNRPHLTGKELHYISQSHANWQLSGDGPFTKRCNTWLEEQTGCRKALLTNSCTAALEMAALLADIRPGDEVIMPSYTFVSTANAFVLRGGMPVFVDVRPDTMNIDETKIEAAITPRTKVVVAVHYAGVGCEMEVIMRIARQHGLLVVEDAAQGIRASYRSQPLGAIGHLSCLSFHETENIISGEGGALLINDERFIERAEIIREKGTNRSRFFRGQVDKYTWVDIGSSYLPGEVIAAFLWAQMEEAETITRRRLELWQRYHREFEPLEVEGKVRRPVVPGHCVHNAHMYYLLLPSVEERNSLIAALNDRNICSLFHYIPLHTSPAGRKYGRVQGSLGITENVAGRVIRLPMFCDLKDEDQDRVIKAVQECTP